MHLKSRPEFAIVVL